MRKRGDIETEGRRGSETPSLFKNSALQSPSHTQTHVHTKEALAATPNRKKTVIPRWINTSIYPLTGSVLFCDGGGIVFFKLVSHSVSVVLFCLREIIEM